MSIDLFAVSAEPTAVVDERAGTLRSGMQKDGRPVSLATWRFTTGDPDVAAKLAELYGGDVSSWETTTEENLQVITEAKSIDIIVDGINSSMVLWGTKGKIRECDGTSQMPDDKGIRKDCACELALADKKADAKAGTGCGPQTAIYFTLADLPGVGSWRFFGGGWTLAKDIQPVEAAFVEAGKVPQYASLAKRLVEFTTGSGEEVSYQTPDLVLKGAAENDEGEPF